jgi:hypothetical protein
MNEFKISVFCPSLTLTVTYVSKFYHLQCHQVHRISDFNPTGTLVTVVLTQIGRKSSKSMINLDQ